MNAITTFDFEGSAVRSTIDMVGDPWWVGKDVCECLGHGNHRDALSRLLDDEKDDVGITDAIGRDQITTVINEPGIYRLIFTSRTAAAERFKHWLAHDVLPSIRKTGRYEISDGVGQVDEIDLLPLEEERLWHSRISLVRRLYGKKAAQWAFETSPLPTPPVFIAPAQLDELAQGEIQACLDVLLDKEIKFAFDGGLAAGPIREFLAHWNDTHSRKLEKALRKFGFAQVIDDNGGWIVFGNTHRFIEGAYKGTQWSNQRWRKIYNHIQGARSWPVTSFGGHKSQCVAIPISTVIGAAT